MLIFINKAWTPYNLSRNYLQFYLYSHFTAFSIMLSLFKKKKSKRTYYNESSCKTPKNEKYSCQMLQTWQGWNVSKLTGGPTTSRGSGGSSMEARTATWRRGQQHGGEDSSMEVRTARWGSAEEPEEVQGQEEKIVHIFKTICKITN